MPQNIRHGVVYWIAFANECLYYYQDFLWFGEPESFEHFLDNGFED